MISSFGKTEFFFSNTFKYTFFLFPTIVVYNSSWLCAATGRYTASRYNPMWLDDFSTRQGTVSGLWTPSHNGGLALYWYWWAHPGPSCDINKGTIISSADNTNSDDWIGLQVKSTSSSAIAIHLVVINMCDGSGTWSDGTKSYSDDVLLQPNSGVATICMRMSSKVASQPFLMRLEAQGPDGIWVVTDEIYGSVTTCDGNKRCQGGVNDQTICGSTQDCHGYPCELNKCTQPAPETYPSTSAGCCSGLGKCSDGKCYKCQPTGTSPTCSGLKCCNGNTKCSDGTCQDCAGHLSKATNCAGCCSGFEKCSDNVCRDALSDCAPDGTSCPNAPCCFGHTQCSNNGNVCQECVTNGNTTNSSGQPASQTCCCSGLKRCNNDPNGKCMDCTPDGGTCNPPNCCAGLVRTTDGVCRSCIPLGKSPTDLDPTGTLKCCSGDSCVDGICRACIPDRQNKCGTLTTCADPNGNCTNRGPCADGKCRAEIQDGERWDNCPAGTPCAQGTCSNGPCIGGKCSNGSSCTTPGLQRCSDGRCHSCPWLKTRANTPFPPLQEGKSLCCTPPTNDSCDNCSLGGGSCGCSSGQCRVCTEQGSSCNPPKECCFGLQRCLDQTCQPCTINWNTCNPSDPCCCQWEAITYSHSCNEKSCEGDRSG